MLETAGTKLRRRRILRQLELRDAARQTRISADRLADLETDEYSNFPNLAYAKSFLRSYARFLEVDLRAYLDAFEDASTFGLDDYQYLSDKPVGVFRVPRRTQQRTPKVRRGSLVMTASLAGICLLLLLGWFFYITYQRLGGDLNQLADRQDAREHGDLRTGAMPSASTESRVLQPAGATPAPTVAVSPAPQGTPSSGDSMGRDLVATTLAQSSPSAVLSQLSAPAANLPVPPAAATVSVLPGMLALQPMLQKAPSLEGNPAGVSPASSPAAATSQDDKRFFVHRLDNNSVDVFRTGVPHAQPPARNTLE